MDKETSTELLSFIINPVFTLLLANSILFAPRLIFVHKKDAIVDGFFYS